MWPSQKVDSYKFKAKHIAWLLTLLVLVCVWFRSPPLSIPYSSRENSSTSCNMLFIVVDMRELSEKHSLVPPDRGVCKCVWARQQSDRASKPEFKSFVIMVNHTHYSRSLFLELHQHCPVLHNRGNFSRNSIAVLPQNSQLSCWWIPTVSTNWDENRARAHMCVLGAVQNNLLFYYQTKLQPNWRKNSCYAFMLDIFTAHTY